MILELTPEQTRLLRANRHHLAPAVPHVTVTLIPLADDPIQAPAPRGLGDLIAAQLRLCGIAAIVHRLTGGAGACGCARRQAWLNRHGRCVTGWILWAVRYAKRYAAPLKQIFKRAQPP